VASASDKTEKSPETKKSINEPRKRVRERERSSLLLPLPDEPNSVEDHGDPNHAKKGIHQLQHRL